MNQLAFKLLLIALIFLLSVICGLLPMKLLQFLRKRAASAVDFHEGRKWPSLLLCLVTCFSGGVFLATCFLHLLPEVTEQMQEIVKEYSWPSAYPLAELISCGGFFLVFLLEELVILCLRGNHHHRGANGNHHHSASVVHVHLVKAPSSASSGENGGSPELPSKAPAAIRSDCTDEDGDTTSTVHVVGRRENGISTVGGGELKTPTFPLLPPCGDSFRSDADRCNGDIPLADVACPGWRGRTHSAHPSPSLYETDLFTFCQSDAPALLPKKTRRNGVALVDDTTRPCSIGGDSEDGNCPGIELPLNAEPECCEGPCDGRKEDPPIMMAYRPHAHSHGVRSITLVVALSFHSLIEGLAFGIQDTAASTTALFLGIIIHKCIIIFSTGVQLARTHAHQLLLVVVTIVLVSLMTPIGAGVGVALEQSWGHSLTRDVTIMFFSGLSVGTFLYVTFFEVLIHERDNEHNNLLKLFAILAGFILMAALRAMDDKHNHGAMPLAENITDPLATTTVSP